MAGVAGGQANVLLCSLVCLPPKIGVLLLVEHGKELFAWEGFCPGILHGL